MKFSVRETQVLDLLQRGLTNKEIGQDLGISAHTVRDHISRMLVRHDLPERAALAVLHSRISLAPRGVMRKEKRAAKTRVSSSSSSSSSG